MYQLVPPPFRFALYLVDQSKFKNNQGQYTICYAHSYEIQPDGSIIFFQLATTLDNKKTKIPTLAYPSGKWEACVLLDDKNQSPIFSGKGSFDGNHVTQPTHQTVSLPPNNYIPSKPNVTNNEDENDEFNLNGLSDDTTTHQSSHHSTPWHKTNPNHSNNNAIPNTSMPGIAQTTADFKKAKNDYLEIQIKEYVKLNSSFKVSDFQTFLSKDSQSRSLKINETDIEWIASNLIREKNVLSRKFSEATIQKTLAIILPDIMRRQWSGKMGPIIQVLQEREETKNVTAIDLAVWMVQNGFE